MILSPRLNKFILTSHITFSVGWFGSVAVFLVLALTGVTSEFPQTARSAYIALNLIGWYVLVPFCFASFLTGVVQSLTTKWGLFKHYWIVVKLVLTVFATVLLLLHMKPIGNLAGLAEGSTFSDSDQIGTRIQLIADAGAAVILLLIITTLSVYKPWGKIKPDMGSNSEETLQIRNNALAVRRSLKQYAMIGFGILLLFVIIKHIAGGGMLHH